MLKIKEVPKLSMGYMMSFWFRLDRYTVTNTKNYLGIWILAQSIWLDYNKIHWQIHNGRAHDCDQAQIFCAHGLIHAHRKSRVIGVRMAMCTSKPIIGKCAGWGSDAKWKNPY